MTMGPMTKEEMQQRITHLAAVALIRAGYARGWVVDEQKFVDMMYVHGRIAEEEIRSLVEFAAIRKLQ